MGQSNKLNIENRVLTDSSNGYGVTSLKVTVESGLGSVLLLKDLDGHLGCRWASKSLGLTAVLTHSSLDLLNGGLSSSELDGDTGGVSVHNSNTGALGRDLGLLNVGERSGVGVDSSQDLSSLPFNLLLLSSNEGDNVVQNVHRRNSGVSSSRDSLESGDHDGVERSELVLKSLQGDNKSGGRAVGVRDEESLVETLDVTLVRDNVEVVGVDEGDHEGSNGVATVVLGVGEDDEVVLDELGLDLSGDIGVESREDNVALSEGGGLALLDDHVLNLLGELLRLLPSGGILVLLSGAAGGGSNGVELEVGVLGEKEDEALSDGTGATENTWDL